MKSPDDVVSHRIVLRQASRIRALRPRWAWENRWPVGEVALLAGRGGLGKSTICYWAAARLTRGELRGEHFGNPRAVLVCATEDSWSHTIIPRLIAAGADLDRVFAVEVLESQGGEDYEGWLSLPRDIPALGTVAQEHNAVLLLLDPLVSRLGSSLNTYRDSDVRRALEPLKRLAESTGMAIVGLIHVTKGGGADPLASVMGSVGFVNVARSVSIVVPDPDDDSDRRRLFGTPKNNVGRDDLPTLAYVIDGAAVETEDGLSSTGVVHWQGEVEGTIRSAMTSGLEDAGVRTATVEAGEWLLDWLQAHGGHAPRTDVEMHGRKAGHSIDALKRARAKLPIDARSEGFPRSTVWVLKTDTLSDSAPPDPSHHQRPDRPDNRPSAAPAPSSAAPTAPTGADLRFSSRPPDHNNPVGAVGARAPRPPATARSPMPHAPAPASNTHSKNPL